jgi:hypothetical protein
MHGVFIRIIIHAGYIRTTMHGVSTIFRDRCSGYQYKYIWRAGKYG